ncbi:methylated-DNA--[protein]-cysteine S-methyltransferase [Armatimonas rosea]|uniref:Methylated-DNA--protein-cysteine methyltransferase n=1 Tax=Armatimonas rosea TaxID=685828 RepID=A0A7W9SRU1_ARMRO|nr:methylated-DNA--[protein]-cysteine S-methyltransferase [Armatimonas rosea]MBB6051024.1 methylated-DNA-[protein]-cysteine S-methyltransferase [Armatimonas rosea]
MIYAETFETRFGVMTVAVDDDGAVVSLDFSESAPEGSTLDPLKTRQAKRQIQEFCDGERTVFELPLAPEGTEFQKLVWAEVAKIPYGQTRTYGQIAAAVGNKDAARAVGAASGANPIPLIVPCHRVIAADGGLGGFAYGTGVKSRLLAFESEQPSLF